MSRSPWPRVVIAVPASAVRDSGGELGCLAIVIFLGWLIFTPIVDFVNDRNDEIYWEANCELSDSQVAEIGSEVKSIWNYMRANDIAVPERAPADLKRRQSNSHKIVVQHRECFARDDRAFNEPGPYRGFRSKYWEIPGTDGSNQSFIIGDSSEVQNSQSTGSSSGSVANSVGPAPDVRPETESASPSQKPKVVKWVPTISAIKFCVNNRYDPNCPGQPGVKVGAGSTFNVDGKAMIQRLIDKDFCQPNLSNGETGPSGSDGEWICYTGADLYVVWTGDKKIAEMMYVLSYKKMAALDGALVFGYLPDELVAFLDATLIKT